MIDKYERFLKKKNLYVTNPTIYLIIFMIIGYSIKIILPNFYTKLFLDPSFVIKGEIWRIFSWLMLTSLDFTSLTNIFYSALAILFFYFVGRNAERDLGTIKYNIFLQNAIFLTILGHFLYFLLLFVSVDEMTRMYLTLTNSININNTPIFMSMFMLWAIANPNSHIRLYFLIPIKIKYMAILYMIITIYDFITKDTGTRITIICAAINLSIFFFHQYRPTKNKKHIKKIVSKNFVHKCVICGKTSDDSSQFRFCSKCTGQKEYCLDHIKNHTHS